MSDGHPEKPLCRWNAPPTGDEPLSRDEALSLFRLYEDKGWAVKQQMLASVSWLTPFVFGLIAYYFTGEAPLNTLVALTAFVLSLFMALLTVISLMHANGDYVRSHKLLKYARVNKLLPDYIFQIILSKEDYLDLLKEDEAKRQLTSLHYIGWQFKVIMGFTFLPVVVSLGITLWATLC